MAAGKGTRMNDPTKAKVMYEISGKPLIGHVLDLTSELGIARNVVVVGHQKETVITYVAGSYPGAECVVQEPQLGTAHAVMQARTVLGDFKGHTIVLSGDVPLLSKVSVNALVGYHLERHATATILTAVMPQPDGYGRIIRGGDGLVRKIVEHRDATDEERKIDEINSGIYVFENQNLFEGLEHIKATNVQQEYYITDIIEYFVRSGLKVAALKVRDVNEIRGINTFEQLQDVQSLMEGRWASEGTS